MNALPYIILGLIFWIACGYAAFGIMFAYFQKEYASIAYKYVGQDKKLARMAFFCGPIGLCICICSGCMKHGFLYEVKRANDNEDRNGNPKPQGGEGNHKNM